MADKADITPELCRQLVRYEPGTGKLYWISRSRSMFLSQRSHSSWNTKYAGTAAFEQRNPEGYLKGVMLFQTFRAQRVAWAVYHGQWPTGHIDHINGDPADNRIANLRDVPREENNKNLRLRAASRSGHTGVVLLPSKRWRAQIRADGLNIHLGVFDTIDEASKARAEAEARYGYHPNHGKPKPI